VLLRFDSHCTRTCNSIGNTPCYLQPTDRTGKHLQAQSRQVKMHTIIHYYRKNEAPRSLLPRAHEELNSRGFAKDSQRLVSVETETCFNVGLSRDLNAIERNRLEWLLAETFEPDQLLLEKSTFGQEEKEIWQVEFGPRLCFTSAFSSNAVSICEACSIPVHRLEVSRRYRFHVEGDLDEKATDILRTLLHDRMTEEEYKSSLLSFDSGKQPEPVKTVPIMEQGRKALEAINNERGLGFDEFDLDYYTDLFKVCTRTHVANCLDWASPTEQLLPCAKTGKTGPRPYRCRVL
jgi:phosphoribosylformylglycinamidine synthase